MQDPRGGSIAKDAFLDFVKRPDGTPVDPEVVTQFNCLQQTGNFCPSKSNASETVVTIQTSIGPLTTLSDPTVSSLSNAQQKAVDALFALGFDSAALGLSD